MQVYVNGEARDFAHPITAHDLVNSLHVSLDGVVLVLNDAVIPADELLQKKIQAGDRVELVRMVGGG